MATKAQRRLRKVSYHSERLYALIRERDGATEMCYRLAPAVAGVWNAVVDEEILGTGHTHETLWAQGWVARQVEVTER